VKRIDTHTHPKISKHFTFDPRAIARMTRRARRAGLDGLAITEHFHGTGFWTIWDHMEANVHLERGLFWAGDLALVPGAEINIAEGALRGPFPALDG